MSANQSYVRAENIHLVLVLLAVLLLLANFVVRALFQEEMDTRNAYEQYGDECEELYGGYDHGDVQNPYNDCLFECEAE